MSASARWSRLALLTALAAAGAPRAFAQLANPDFDSGLDSWTATPSSATPEWDEFVGDPSPGSVRIYSAFPPFNHEFPRLGQCLSVAPGFEPSASARIRGDDVRIDDACGIELFFYACGACACPSIDFTYGGGVGTTIGWQTATDTESAPETAASASVQLWAHLAPVSPGAFRGGGAGATDCRFDTVRLTVRLFANGFEGGTVCAWSDQVGSGDSCG